MFTTLFATGSALNDASKGADDDAAAAAAATAAAAFFFKLRRDTEVETNESAAATPIAMDSGSGL